MSERQSLPNMGIVWLLQFLRNLCSVLELTAIHDFCLNSGNSGPIASSDTMDRTCILELIILVIKNILQTYSDEVLVT